MKKRWPRLLIACLAGYFFTAAAPVVWARAVPSVSSPAPNVSAKAAELVDAQSGKVLYEKNPNKELPMASVTKLMTLYLAVRAIERHKIGLHNLVPVSDEAYHVGGSQIWLEPGERLTVEQMMKGVAIGSANDAAYALGEYLAGSPEGFVEQMNRTARHLGMMHTQFQNAHGLSADGHYTTVHDLGLLAQKAVKMPLLLHYTSMWQDRTIRNGKGGTLWLINHNRLLRQYAGADGLKTGYTSQAGFCIVATAKQDRARMIAVVLGSPSSKARFQSAANLMTWGFQNFRSIRLARAGQVLARIPVIRGSQPAVEAVVKRSHIVTVGVEDADQVRITRTLPDRIPAPVNKGQSIGTLTARTGSKVLATVPIVAGATVRAVGWPETVWRYFWKLAG